MRRQNIKAALLGGLLGLLCFTAAVATYFTFHPLDICCRWEGDKNYYWVFEGDGSFDRMLAERFPGAPQKQFQFRLCYYEWAVLTWLNLYGEPFARKLPLAIFLGASCALAADRIRQRRTASKEVTVT